MVVVSVANVGLLDHPSCLAAAGVARNDVVVGTWMQDLT